MNTYSLCIALTAIAAATVGRWLAHTFEVALMYHPQPFDEEYRQEVTHMSSWLRKYSYQLDEIYYNTSALHGVGVESHRAFLLRPKKKETGTLWAIMGGNAMLSPDWFRFLQRLILLPRSPASRVAFLLLDYPGYGVNQGAPSPRSVLQASLEALRATLEHLAALTETREPPTEVNLLGHSIGAAAAAQLAAHLSKDAVRGQLDTRLERVPAGQLVLSSPFLNIEAMGVEILSALLPRPLLRIAIRHLIQHRWDNSVAVPEAERGGWNVSIVHPEKDGIVPVEQGRALRDLLRGSGRNCTYIEVRRGNHNTVLDREHGVYAKLLGYS
eukprot:gnl/TRDRNA2_/TRDRNA2_197830_c0_seq1.p1 gnl/TRDRNA2_/TRDRNA2_197830_c0~~gnl/TRDRNA2_/TRDRNA2_197830_c0_seq1.p1  ORF type:complete len:327 (-),score=39.56 gnl/TRDRNA2_/TRDRNA2_197830_c0_seq1:71-1051(-)